LDLNFRSNSSLNNQDSLNPIDKGKQSSGMNSKPNLSPIIGPEQFEKYLKTENEDLKKNDPEW